MANATKAQGTTITIDATPIGELTNIGSPEIGQEAVEVSTLADTWQTFISGGLKTSGEVTLSGNYYSANAGQAALRAAVDGASHAIVITLQDTGNETIAFSAFVTKLGGPEAEKAAHLKFQVTLRPTGAIVFTA